MVANAGTIEAQLILNASQFQKGMQSAMATAQGMGKTVGNASKNASAAMANATRSTQKMSSAINQASSHASSFSNNIASAGRNINSYQSYTRAATAAQANFTNSLKTSTGLFSGLGRQVNEAASSFNNMGNAYKTAITPIQSNTSKISSAFSSLGSSGAAAFGKVGSGIMNAGNALANMVGSVVSFNVWFGALAGKLFYDFTVGAAMAVEETKSLFKFVGMSTDEVNRLDTATKSYAASAAKVSQPELLSSWRLVRISQKLSADEMIKYNSTMGDTIALFKANGQTAEKAGLAIEDAMAGGSDGIRRLKEIGISDMQELYDRGFDPSKPATFFAALQKLYEDRGVSGYASKVNSLADRFENLKEKIQLAGVAAGEVLMPGMESIVNALTTVFEYLGPTVSGVMIAFTGLTVILGFFWPTLMTIGSALGTVAAKLLAAAGATAVYGAAMAGPGNSGTIGLLQSLQSIPPATKAAAAGFAVAVAGLIALTYALHVANSASAAWVRAEEAKNNQVKALEGNNKLLNAQIDALIQKRNEEAEAGKNTYLTDQLIAAKRKEVTANTNAAADAEKRYKDALSIKSVLESKGQASGDTAMTEGRAASQGMTVQEYLQSQPEGAETNIALEKTAMLQANINTAKFKYAGTMERINKQEDNYSKYWKGNQEGLQRYSKTYEAFATSSENYFKAQEEGKLERMIFFVVESGFLQAQLAVSEFWASVAATGADLENLFKNNIGKSAANMLKPAENAAKWLQESWDGFPAWFGGFTARLGELWGETTSYFQGAWNNTVLFFQGGAAWIQGAWNNTVAFFQGAWNNTVNTIMNGWNWLTSTIGNISIGVTSWGTWVFNWLVEQYNWVKSILSNPISLVVSGAAGMNAASSRAVSIGQNAAAKLQNSSGPINLLKTAMNGLGYQNYNGHQKTPAQVIADGCGNCVDLSLTAAALGSGMGIRSELMLGSWNGGGHAWGRYNGQQLDFSRKVLQNTYIPPARGPGGSNGAYYDLRGATILDGPSFEKMIEKTNNKMVRRY